MADIRQPSIGVTPRMTRLLADVLQQQGVNDDSVKIARSLMKAMMDEPETVVKWLVVKDVIELVKDEEP